MAQAAKNQELISKETGVAVRSAFHALDQAVLIRRQSHPPGWRRIPGNRGQSAGTYDDDNVSTHRRQPGTDAVARRLDQGSGGAGPRNVETRRPRSRTPES